MVVFEAIGTPIGAAGKGQLVLHCFFLSMEFCISVGLLSGPSVPQNEKDPPKRVFRCGCIGLIFDQYALQVSVPSSSQGGPYGSRVCSQKVLSRT